MSEEKQEVKLSLGSYTGLIPKCENTRLMLISFVSSADRTDFTPKDLAERIWTIFRLVPEEQRVESFKRFCECLKPYCPDKGVTEEDEAEAISEFRACAEEIVESFKKGVIMSEKKNVLLCLGYSDFREAITPLGVRDILPWATAFRRLEHPFRMVLPPKEMAEKLYRMFLAYEGEEDGARKFVLFCKNVELGSYNNDVTGGELAEAISEFRVCAVKILQSLLKQKGAKMDKRYVEVRLELRSVLKALDFPQRYPNLQTRKLVLDGLRSLVGKPYSQMELANEIYWVFVLGGGDRYRENFKEFCNAIALYLCKDPYDVGYFPDEVDEILNIGFSSTEIK